MTDLSSWLLVVSLVLAVLGGAAVVSFESPIRSAGGLVTAFVGVAAAASGLAAPLVSGVVLWVGGAIAVLLLACVLLLNVPFDERGHRRIRVLPTLGAPVLALLFAALAAPLLDRSPVRGGAGSSASEALGSADVAAVAVGELGVWFGAALVAMSVAVVAGVALVRRRS